jgi:hypothetical protein
MQLKSATAHIVRVRYRHRTRVVFTLLLLCSAGMAACAISGGCWRGASVADLVGVYHLSGIDDATNLFIENDGSFRWEGDSCDSAGGDSGRLLIRMDSVVLIPANESDLFFPLVVLEGYSGPFPERVSSVRVALLPTGEVVTSVGDASLTWVPGKVCSICEGTGSGRISVGTEPCE